MSGPDYVGGLGEGGGTGGGRQAGGRLLGLLLHHFPHNTYKNKLEFHVSSSPSDLHEPDTYLVQFERDLFFFYAIEVGLAVPRCWSFVYGRPGLALITVYMNKILKPSTLYSSKTLKSTSPFVRGSDFGYSVFVAENKMIFFKNYLKALDLCVYMEDI